MFFTLFSDCFRVKVRFVAYKYKIYKFEFFPFVTVIVSIKIKEMAPKQRMRIANEKASKNVTMRGNVPKSTVSFFS